ncbi:hypothetical protein [Cellulomonas sp. KH9]|uniref:hypothetical protein n=1 Tax=Cellulomonas sp. KH9 TaxID=1855324 RepID=UPI0008E7AFE0|nr:hypothetical protein [Cellulomonas sp. KH9]SFK47941.1 hypothetical protein SAMN05216467_3523 [Cellulomonas sp. KH9]
MTARTLLPVLTVGALLLAGCTTEAAEPAGLTASPTATSSPTPEPTPSPTPTDGIQVHDDPELGIVFEDVPDLTGDEADVYNWIATYQKAYWQTLRTNEVSDIFATFTSSEIQDTMARIPANNSSSNATIAGTFRTRISDIVVAGDTATGVKCDDLGEATFTNDTGTFTAEDVGKDVAQRNKLELIRVDGGIWYVNRLVGDGTC